MSTVNLNWFLWMLCNRGQVPSFHMNIWLSQSHLLKRPGFLHCTSVSIFLGDFSLFFWLYHVACEMLVPWPGIELRPQQWVANSLALSPNHWTAKEFPRRSFFLEEAKGSSNMGRDGRRRMFSRTVSVRAGQSCGRTSLESVRPVHSGSCLSQV